MAAPLRSREHRLLVALAVLVPLALAALALGLEPDPRGYGTHEQLGMAPCGVREWMGIPCPACGITTSVVLCVQGHPLRSALNQPFGTLATVAAMAFALLVIAAHLRGRDAWTMLAERVSGRWLWAALAAFLAGWAWRVGRERLAG